MKCLICKCQGKHFEGKVCSDCREDGYTKDDYKDGEMVTEVLATYPLANAFMEVCKAFDFDNPKLRSRIDHEKVEGSLEYQTFYRFCVDVWVPNFDRKKFDDMVKTFRDEQEKLKEKIVAAAKKVAEKREENKKKSPIILTGDES